MTKVAWETNKDEISKARPGATRQAFLYNLSRASYEKEWGNEYERPGICVTNSGFLFRLFHASDLSRRRFPRADT